MVTSMFSIQAYVVEDKEVMVLDGTQGFMPGTAAIRRLCSRWNGVGADRLILFTGTEQHPSFRAFEADGTECDLTAEDLKILSRTDCNLEIRLTDHFVGILQSLEEVCSLSA